MEGHSGLSARTVSPSKARKPNEDLSSSFGDMKTSELVKKHASKVVFSTSGVVKGLISKLQSESVLVEELFRRQLAQEERRGHHLAEDFAAALGDAVAAVAEGKPIVEKEYVDALPIDAEVTTLLELRQHHESPTLSTRLHFFAFFLFFKTSFPLWTTFEISLLVVSRAGHKGDSRGLHPANMRDGARAQGGPS